MSNAFKTRKECSHFSSPRAVDTNTVGSRKGNMENDFMSEIVNFLNLFPKILISGHLNINGLRNFFFEIHDILKDNLLDLFFFHFGDQTRQFFSKCTISSARF